MRPSKIPEIRELMSRDYREDVRRLNGLLNRHGDAGLQEVPPVPFTGNIDAMERGKCICLIGINPQFPALSRDAHKDEIAPTKKMVDRSLGGDSGAYQEFIDSRLGYFEGAMANWVHYGKLGKGYAENFFLGETDRSVWGRHAFAADILPYWSTDTSKISMSRFRMQINEDPALLLHQRMLARVIEETRPDFVHINGISAGRLFQKLYCSEHPLEPWGDLGDEHNLMFGHASFGEFRVPIMTHNQFGQWGPSSRHWPEFAGAWRQWKSNQ